MKKHEYKKMLLAKVTNSNGIEYFAVTEETLDNMEDSSAAATYIIPKKPEDYAKAQFKVENLGEILVEITEDE